MKLCTYSVAGGPPRVGIVDGDEVRPVAVPDMRALFERGAHTAEPAVG